MSRLLVATLLLAAALPAQSLTTANDVIGGAIVNAIGNAPLAKVLVTVTPVVQAVNPGQRIPSRFAITDSDGRFAFLNIPPGKYTLSAARPHDPPQLYLSDGSQYSTAIVTGAGVDPSQLVFPYHPGGSIHGKVVDENGEPLRNANAHLFRHALVDGRSQYAMAGQSQTRADGSFHFSHLADGTYFVGVDARPWFAGPGARPDIQNKPEFDVAYPFTYYPGATEFSGASPITLADGATASVQVAMRSVPAIHPPVPAPSGSPGPSRNLQFMVEGPGGLPVMNSSSMLIQTPGGPSFGLAPGRYRVLDFGIQGNRAQASIGRTVDLTSDAPIDLAPPPKLNVSGAVTIEGADKPTNRILVMLASGNVGGSNNMMGNTTAETAADGSFNFGDKGLQPGRYQVMLPNNPAFFLKSITAKGTPLADGELDLTASSNVQLSLVIAPFRNASLDGVATRDGRPAAGAMVLLLPANKGQAQLIRRDQSDLDGSFTFHGVAPGSYRLVAIDNGRDLAYRDPEAVKPYLALGKPVTIPDGPMPSGIKIDVQTRTQ